MFHLRNWFRKLARQLSLPSPRITAPRRYHPGLRVRLQLERLEPIILPSQVTWTGTAGDNNWDSGGNWSTGDMPGSGDDVVINVGSPTTIVHSSAVTDTVNSLVSNAAIVLSGGTLDVNTTLSDSAGVTLQGGTLASATGTLDITSGTISGYGTLGSNVTIASAAGLSLGGANGSLAVEGNLVLQGTLTDNIAGSQINAAAGYQQLDISGNFENDGTVNVSGIAAGADDTFHAIEFASQSGSGSINVDPSMNLQSFFDGSSLWLLPSSAQTFTVTTTADSGSGSLRDAITQANAASSFSVIAFNIPTSDSGYSGGVWTIAPTSALPALTNSVLLDGTAQPGYAGKPLIDLSGASAGGVNGLTLSAGKSTIEGLIINNFTSNGIEVTGAAAVGDTIAGNYIGTDAGGTTAAGNSGYGIEIDSSASNITIGGAAAADRNIISGNVTGIHILGSDNTVLGNYIGTDVTGTARLGNGVNGIAITAGSNNTIGGTAAGAGNVLSGNQNNGLALSGTASNALVVGNIIGLNAAGTAVIANHTYGVSINSNSSDNTIGGTTAAARNIISGNQGGVFLLSGGTSTGNVIEGNYIGTDITGTAKLGNDSDGIYVASSGNTVGGNTAGAGNVISGNNIGIEVVSQSNVVAGNYVGTDPSGTTRLGNTYLGVLIHSGASDNTVGGTTAAARNLISGNTSYGIEISDSGTDGNVVEGNYIGTDVTGNKALGNGSGGVLVEVNASGNTIGGTAAGTRNVISGNNDVGIAVGGSNNVVLGNYIGTNASGTARLGAGSGVIVSGTGQVIGGTAAGAGNLISGNDVNGIWIQSATGAVIQGNYIGTTADGTAVLFNRQNGIQISSGSNNTIGGTAAGAGNVISGNVGGIDLESANSNVIQGNLIGTRADGTGSLGNESFGISLLTSNNNVIGGTAAGAANIIAANGLTATNAGVVVHSGTGNTIRGNSIHDNTGIGIDLGNSNGVTPNDAGDADTGPNNLQNFPVLSAAVAGSSTRVLGSLNSTASITFTLDFYANTAADPTGYGEGQRYLGSTTVTTDASGNVSFDVTLSAASAYGEYVSATATDPNGDTSEFSADVALSPPGSLFVTNTNDSGAGSLRQAILDANAAAGSNTILFAIPTTDAGYNSTSGVWTIAPTSALPTISDTIILDATTQAGYAGKPLIDLRGINAGASSGLVLSAGNSTIRGLVINNFQDDGIDVTGAAAVGDTIVDNYIGTDSKGGIALANQYGIVIENGAGDNTLGGTTTADRNLISGNSAGGIWINGAGSGNVVEGNYIGTDVTGTVALGNGNSGVDIASANNTIGGNVAGAGNVISGNAGNGVLLTGSAASGNVVAGNFIGLNAAGTAAVKNTLNGVLISAGASSNRIGTDGDGVNDALERNVISGNASGSNANINIIGTGTNNNVVAGNYIGLNAAGTATVINGGRGIRIAVGASFNRIGTDGSNDAFNADERNIVSGSSDVAIFIAWAAGNPAVTMGNIVAGNWVGLNAAGTVALGNAATGIYVSGGQQNRIGTNTDGIADAAEANVIVGSAEAGIQLSDAGTQQNVVAGNFIGTNPAGTAAMPNAGGGIVIGNDAVSNTIGGTTPAARNVISGNSGNGVQISGSGATGNLIEGNYIGIGASITVDAVPVANDGFETPDLGAGSNAYLSDPTGDGWTFVGGYISGIAANNSSWGVTNATNGNSDGTTSTAGQAAVIFGGDGATSNTYSSAIYQTISGFGNGMAYIQFSLAGHAGYETDPIEVMLDGQDLGTYTPTDQGTFRTVVTHAVAVTAGTHTLYFVGDDGGRSFVDNVRVYLLPPALGNSGNGILVSDGAADNTIGGSAVGAGNVISLNQGWGIDLASANDNTVQGNFISTDTTGNVGLGGSGIAIYNGSNNLIGGTTAGAGNVISGSQGWGVFIGDPNAIDSSTTANNTIDGNVIGLNAAGAYAISNTIAGIEVSYASSTLIAGNTIAGTLADSNNPPNAPNGQAGYDGAGILAFGPTPGTLIQDNKIGTDESGEEAVANQGSGIYLWDAVATITGNQISGNKRDGITVNGNAVPDGFSGLWHADGNTADDKGVEGTLLAGATYAPGISGQAFSFNAVDAAFEDNAGESRILYYYGGTMAGWIRTTAGSGTLMTDGGGIDTATGMGLFLENGQLVARGSNGTAGQFNFVLTSPQPINDGQWHHVAVTWSGTTTADGVTLYVDGVAVATGTAQSTISGGSTRLYFGGEPGTALPYYNGLLDEVVVYSHALSARDIAAIYSLRDVAQTNIGSTIAGNLIGTNADGTAALANGVSFSSTNAGINISDSSFNTIGGTTATDRNLISGNKQYGVIISGIRATANTIEGNYIGTNATSTADIGNLFDGVRIEDASGNTIGGTTAGAGNVISGNINTGIVIVGAAATGNAVEGNDIGTGSGGLANPVPVADDGFETPNLGTGSGAYQYKPTGSDWTFVGSTGIAANNSAWGFTDAANGNDDGTTSAAGQAAFIQNGDGTKSGSAIYQTIAGFGSGTISIEFSLQGRAGYGTNPIEVMLDNEYLGYLISASTLGAAPSCR